MVCTILPTLGTVVLGVSLWADLTGYWADKPFITNMVSALVGALFGIPFALVVIQRLALAQASTIERDAVQRFGLRTKAELMTTVSRICGTAELRNEHQERQFRTIEGSIIRLRKALSDLERQSNDSGTLTGHSVFGEMHEMEAEVVHDLLEKAQRASDAWHEAMGDRNSTEESIMLAHHQWETLSNYVRPRFLEAGLPWVDATSSENFQNALHNVRDSLLIGWLPDITSRIQDELRHGDSRRRVKIYRSRWGDIGASIAHEAIADWVSHVESCFVFLAQLDDFSTLAGKVVPEIGALD